MRIDNKLNLVIPVDTDNGTLYVHATPISRETFEQYALLIGQTFATIYRQRLELVAGPRLAMILLRKCAKDLGVMEGPDRQHLEPAQYLIAEIRRLTNVMVPSEKGFQIYPLQDAIDHEILTPDDISEVEGAVVFFMLSSAMHLRKDLPAILAGMTSLWDAQTTLLGCTEYVASLPKSIEVPDLTTPTSSVPS
jgi:hypothetical protein